MLASWTWCITEVLGLVTISSAFPSGGPYSLKHVKVFLFSAGGVCPVRRQELSAGRLVMLHSFGTGTTHSIVRVCPAQPFLSLLRPPSSWLFTVIDEVQFPAAVMSTVCFSELYRLYKSVQFYSYELRSLSSIWDYFDIYQGNWSQF